MSYDLKDPEQAKQYLDNLGVEFRFQCFHEKQPDGCHRLADFEESVRQNHQKAATVYRSNCLDSQYGHSCYKYGNYLMTGRGGVAKDARQAFDFYTRGCDASFMRSCHNLALIVGTGKAISHKQNFVKAVELFNKACDGGDANSCYQLSSIFIQGKEGVEKDMTRAAQYSERACDMGVMYACANLSRMFTKGDGVEKDLDKARTYRKRAKEIEGQVKQQEHTMSFTG